LIVASFGSHNPLNASGVENQDKYLRFLTPIKFRGGFGKMSEWIFQIQPRTKPLIYFCRVTAVRAGPGLY